MNSRENCTYLFLHNSNSRSSSSPSCYMCLPIISLLLQTQATSSGRRQQLNHSVAYVLPDASLQSKMSNILSPQVMATPSAPNALTRMPNGLSTACTIENVQDLLASQKRVLLNDGWLAVSNAQKREAGVNRWRVKTQGSVKSRLDEHNQTIPLQGTEEQTIRLEFAADEGALSELEELETVPMNYIELAAFGTQGDQ